MFERGADLAELPGALWEGSGCAIVRGFPVDALGFEEMYLETASQLGTVVPQTVSGVMIYSVRDEGYSLERDFGRAGGVTHLHGRSAYEDYPEPERKRHYLRIWVERERKNDGNEDE